MVAVIDSRTQKFWPNVVYYYYNGLDLSRWWMYIEKAPFERFDSNQFPNIFRGAQRDFRSDNFHFVSIVDFTLLFQ